MPLTWSGQNKNKDMGESNLRLRGLSLTAPETPEAIIYPAYATQHLLLEAYQENDLTKIHRLLHTIDPAAPIKDGKTLAEIATEDNNFEVLEMLKEFNIDFNKPTTRNIRGLTPFQQAVVSENTRTVRKLYEMGADPNQKFPNGEYAVHKACTFQRVRILELLLGEFKADVNVFDRQNNSVLHRACLEDSIRHAKIIIPFCDVQLLNHKGYEGKTALHIAAMNQNRGLVKLLLDSGAYIDVPANNGKTALDVIMAMDSGALINDLADYFTQSVTKDMQKKETFAQMTHDQNFVRFLSFLQTVDSEPMTCSVVSSKTMKAEEESALLNSLVTDEKIDVIEFKEVFLKLLKTETIHAIVLPENTDILEKVAFNVARYVLFREDLVMLEKIVACGPVWKAIHIMLENRWDELLVHTPERGVSGIIRHLRDLCFEKRQVNRELLCTHYGKHCNVHDLEPIRNPEFNPDVTYMRHPMNTLAVWSILTGRFRLTEVFLKHVQFDVLPLALFSSAMIRTYSDGDCGSLGLNAELLENVANKCELFAVEAINNICSVDTSYKSEVTTDYLLTPLPSYGNTSCIELAAQNGSAKFLQTVAGQLSLDRLWYGFLVEINPFLRQLLILMGITPFNVLIPVILKRCLERKRNKAAGQNHEKDSDDAEEAYCNFLIEDHKGAAVVSESDTDPLLSSIKKPNIESRNNSNSKVIERAETLDVRLKTKSTKSNKKKRSPCSNFFSMLIQFYNTPAVKFQYYTLVHVTLVLILSYILLIDLEYTIDWREITIYLIILGFAVEESREVVHHIMINDLALYMSDYWNLIDLTALFFASMGFITRMTYIKLHMENSYLVDSGDVKFLLTFNNKLRLYNSSNFVSLMHSNFHDNTWYYARICLAIACMLYWVRLLYISTVLEVLGPKLKMIGKMITKDLLPFLVILFIFIFGFGVLMHGILFPNGFRLYNEDKMLFKEVMLQMFKVCFYSMVGDYSLELIMGGNDCDEISADRKVNADKCPHDIGRILVPYVIMPMYVIVTEILLLNLIIALFSKTIEEIDSKSTSLWQFERYDLISGYVSRSTLPPPFNILLFIRKGILRIIEWFKGRNQKPEYVDQILQLQFLLFQAIGLRQKRSKIMEDCTEDTERAELIQQIKNAVRIDMLEILSTASYKRSGRKKKNGEFDDYISDDDDSEMIVPIKKTTEKSAPPKLPEATSSTPPVKPPLPKPLQPTPIEQTTYYATTVQKPPPISKLPTQEKTSPPKSPVQKPPTISGDKPETKPKDLNLEKDLVFIDTEIEPEKK